jgi:ribose-phosphate pyrophosphokinase
MPAIASHLRASAFDPRTVIVGPDAESRPWVSELGALLNVNFTVARKTRLGDRSVEIVLDDPQALKGCPALLVDDIVSSGGTMMSCARAVIAAGAISIDAIVIHALFQKQLMEDFTKSGIRTIRSTTSVPHFTNAIALDRLLADALRAELIAGHCREVVS